LRDRPSESYRIGRCEYRSVVVEGMRGLWTGFGKGVRGEGGSSRRGIVAAASRREFTPSGTRVEYARSTGHMIPNRIGHTCSQRGQVRSRRIQEDRPTVGSISSIYIHLAVGEIV
jgi:hypothetical protein